QPDLTDAAVEVFVRLGTYVGDVRPIRRDLRIACGYDVVDQSIRGQTMHQRSVGRPAWRQADVPPTRLFTLENPTCLRKRAARTERVPPSHTTSTSRSRGKSSNRSARSACGIETAPGTWPAAYSAGSLTSTITPFRALIQPGA